MVIELNDKIGFMTVVFIRTINGTFEALYTFYSLGLISFQKTAMPNDQQMKLRSEKHYSSSIDKSLRPPKKEEESKIGPILLGVFLFVIVGSTLFQILNVTTANNADVLA